MTVNLSEHAAARSNRRRVWDAPVRVTHALLATCVAGTWLTRERGNIDLHATFGYCALGLVAFRVAWGLTAHGHARFASFAYGPRDVIEYLRGALRGAPRHYTGHNPAGSWSVFGLLSLVGCAAALGVLTIGGIHGLGPAAGLLSFAAADQAREWHETMAWAVLILALLHVAGVAWGSWVHRENLAAAMVNGRKVAHDNSTLDAPRHGALATTIAVAAFGFAFAYLGAIVPRDETQRRLDEGRLKSASKTLPWTVECGSCHLAYAPALLPMRSWDRMLEEQHEHFGEDLGLSVAKMATLRAFAANAPVASWSAWKLQRSVQTGDAPQRVSEVRFWRRAHSEIPDGDFRPPFSAGRHDCEACHADALSGIFHPRMIHIPKAGVGS